MSTNTSYVEKGYFYIFVLSKYTKTFSKLDSFIVTKYEQIETRTWYEFALNLGWIYDRAFV